MNDLRFHDAIDAVDRLRRELGDLEDRGVRMRFAISQHLNPILELVADHDELRSQHAALLAETIGLRGQLAETRANLAAIVERQERDRQFDHMIGGVE